MNQSTLVRERRLTSEQWALVVFLCAEIAALVLFMVLGRRMWFANDEWEFLAARTGGNLGDLFRPHFDHWVTLPVLAYRALWSIFGLRTYRPYQLSIVLMHLTAAFLLRMAMRRAGVRAWTATMVAAIFVFLGSDFLNILSPFQITIVGSIVFGLVQLLLVTHDDGFGPRDIWGLGAGCAALMCSGVGVATAVAVGVAVFMRRGWRLALLQTAPLGVLYLTWYAVIGHQRGPGSIAVDTNPLDVARYVVHLFWVTFVAIGQRGAAGALLIILLAGGLAVAWRPLTRTEFRHQAAIPVGLLVGGLAFVGMTAVARSGLGDSAAYGNRYYSVVSAFALPALAVALDAIMLRWRAAVPVVIIAALVGIPANVNDLARFSRNSVVVEYQAQFRQLMLSLPRVRAAKQVPRDIVPFPDGFTYLVTNGWLLDGAASGRIPKPGRITPAERASDTLRLSLRQASAEEPPGDVCATLQQPRTFHLQIGQHIVIGARNATAIIEPLHTSSRGTLPFTNIPVGGAEYIAVRPVAFRVRSLVKALEFVCADPASFEPNVHTIAR